MDRLPPSWPNTVIIKERQQLLLEHFRCASPIRPEHHASITAVAWSFAFRVGVCFRMYPKKSYSNMSALRDIPEFEDSGRPLNPDRCVQRYRAISGLPTPVSHRGAGGERRVPPRSGISSVTVAEAGALAVKKPVTFSQISRPGG